MGTHPKAPAMIASSGEKLSDFLSSKKGELGDVITTQFGQNLPFLLKILSVNQALSIQGKITHILNVSIDLILLQKIALESKLSLSPQVLWELLRFRNNLKIKLIRQRNTPKNCTPLTRLTIPMPITSPKCALRWRSSPVSVVSDPNQSGNSSIFGRLRTNHTNQICRLKSWLHFGSTFYIELWLKNWVIP